LYFISRWEIGSFSTREREEQMNESRYQKQCQVQNPNTPTSPFRNKTICTCMHIGAGLSFYAMARRAKLRSRSLSKSQTALHACQKECDWLLVRQMGDTRTHGRGHVHLSHLNTMAGHLAPKQALTYHDRLHHT
jgi:hypothetical protein